MIDLRLGDYRDVLQDVTCDAVICDPPYGQRTHGGHNSGVSQANAHGQYVRADITYAAWSESDVVMFAEFWRERCKGWIAVLTSHDLVDAFSDAMNERGRYVFQPLPVVKIGGRVRLVGDGPSSWTVWLVVARPRNRDFASWGTLPGAYIQSGAIERLEVAGGKSLFHMQSIIRDYSRPGDLICDPCAGGATTLIAAATQGRRAVGAEMDPVTYEKAMRRIKAGYTPDWIEAHA